MKHIIALINLFSIALIVAPATAQADTLSDKSEKKVIQIYGVGVLDKNGKVVWHLHGADESKMDMKLVKHRKGKYEFEMSGSTPSGNLYEEVYWELMENGDFDHVITKKVVGGTPQKAFGFILKKKLNKKR